MPEISKDTKKTFGNMFGLFRKKEEQADSSMDEKSSPKSILSGIYRLLVEREEYRKLQQKEDDREKNQQQKEEEKRHQEILKALTLKREPKKKIEKEVKKEVDKKPKEKKEVKKSTETPPKTDGKQPAETPKAGEKTTPETPKPKAEPVAPQTKPVTPTPTPTPSVSVPPPKPPVSVIPTPKSPVSAAPVPALPSIPTAAKVAGAAITGITISNIARASTKGEQNVSTVEDALKPVTDEKIAKKTGVPIGVPKVGAATPDLQNSTSYGLFGINNIRKINQNNEPIVGSSSIDSFVKMFPSLGLPDPGSPKEPEKTKIFNEAWWNIARFKPEELLKAQLEWFNKTFEEPSNKILQNLPKNISSDPGVQLFMADRRIQYGPQIANNALEIGKDAKTPEEFIRVVADYDKRNLRKYFASTKNEQYEKIEKGLQNRIEHRIKMSLEILNTGSDIDKVSTENKEMKKELSENQTMVNQTTNNISVNSTTEQRRQPQKIDDRSVFDRVTKGN